MNDFGIGRIQDFEHLPPGRQAKEAARTVRVIRELLAKPRSEFPAVEVRFAGKEVSEVALDRAFTLARLRLKQRGGDVLEELARQLPAVLADEAARRARVEHVTVSDTDGARRASEARLEGLPKEGLRAPLLLVPLES